MAARRKSPASETRAPTFEERLEALERVVQELEGEELALEDAIGRYQEGVAHLQACRALLDAAEKRLVELVQEGGADDATGERRLKVTDQGLEPADEA